MGAFTLNTRDARLDFWRALCLIDMVLVHLVYEGVNFGPLQRALGEYTRFAAGGFVFVAGLSIGAIFLPRTFRPNGRRTVYFSLWRRAFYILCVHYAATLSFVSLDLIRGMRAEVPHLPPLMRDILLLREGGDLLPLYVILVAATPVVLDLLRRPRWRWLPAVASVGLFAWGHAWEPALRFPMGQNFPVVLWQLMFTGGLLFGAALPRYNALATRTKTMLAALACVISVVLWAADYRSDFGWAYPRLPLVFCKTPLSAGEALRYFGLTFTIIFSTDLLWNRLNGNRVVKWVSPIGRKSLGCYVGHAWIVGVVGMIAHATTGAGAWQMMLAIPAVVAVWLVAIALEWNSSVTKRIAPPTPTLSRWLPIPLACSAALVLFCGVGVIAARRMPPPAAESQAIAIPDITDDDLDTNSNNGAPPSFDAADAADIIPT
ncbi:MAG TPA: OpgC domain-containing protein [Tepidisphaeraceae bacterium]|nr:OpgC domain-containing protein [Tepidisphaeraceae bacterium]